MQQTFDKFFKSLLLSRTIKNTGILHGYKALIQIRHKTLSITIRCCFIVSSMSVFWLSKFDDWSQCIPYSIILTCVPGNVHIYTHAKAFRETSREWWQEVGHSINTDMSGSVLALADVHCVHVYPGGLYFRSFSVRLLAFSIFIWAPDAYTKLSLKYSF